MSSKATPASVASAFGKAYMKRAVLQPDSLVVPTVRVAHTLEWIREFTRGHSGAISKTYSMQHRKAPISVIITTDASPWGYGGFVLVRNVCLGYFAQEITDEDVQRFGIVIGEARFQALVENLALLIAVRLWAAIWAGQRLAVGLRSEIRWQRCWRGGRRGRACRRSMQSGGKFRSTWPMVVTRWMHWSTFRAS